MDVYLPTLEALKFFWPRVVDGGVIVLDDYPTIVPVAQAIHEFADPLNIPVTVTAMMQCAFVKQ